MVLSTRASKVVRMGLLGLMVRFSTFLDAPRRALVPGLPERIAAVKRKTGDKNGGASEARMAPQAPTCSSGLLITSGHGCPLEHQP